MAQHNSKEAKAWCEPWQCNVIMGSRAKRLVVDKNPQKVIGCPQLRRSDMACLQSVSPWNQCSVALGGNYQVVDDIEIDRMVNEINAAKEVK